MNSTKDQKKDDAPPPPPPNTPEPQQLSEETLKLVAYYDTLDEEDVMTSSERLERVNRTPIPPNATYIPAGEESDSDEDLW